MLKPLIYLSLFASLNALASVYGVDSRQPVRTSSAPSALKSPARSVAILISSTDISDSRTKPGFKDFSTDTIENNQYLCPQERYAKLASFYVSCTGFLIAPDILITAGHCALNTGEAHNEVTAMCRDFSWYFDFEMNNTGRVETKDINPDNIYECESILRASHITKKSSDNSWAFDDDFAIVKLKRPVLDRTPIKLTSVRPKTGEKVSMIGHPLGGPKMTATGSILSNENRYDRSSLSAFPGNSGSPVFNSLGEAFGILVRGYPESLIDVPGRTCRIVNTCDSKATKCRVNDSEGIPAGEHLMPLGLIPELKQMGLIK